MITLRNKSSGFTIIEVLIVIGATGMLMIGAFLFIGNQVSNTGFQTGTRTFQAQLQAIVNQITSGSYTYPDNIYCKPGFASANTSIANKPSIASGSTKGQGSNKGCVFLGKAIYISNYPNVNHYANYSSISTFPVLGNQCEKYTSDYNLSTDIPICLSFPTDLGASKADIITTPTNLIDNYIIEGGVKINNINFMKNGVLNTTAINNLCGFAIVNTPNATASGSSETLWGLDKVGIYPNPCRSKPDTNSFQNLYTAGIANQVDSIKLCMSNANNINQTALLDISYSNNVLSSPSLPQGQTINISIKGKC
jgi:type II secretory pathway pseudopilin PulG